MSFVFLFSCSSTRSFVYSFVRLFIYSFVRFTFFLVYFFLARLRECVLPFIWQNWTITVPSVKICRKGWLFQVTVVFSAPMMVKFSKLSPPIFLCPVLPPSVWNELLTLLMLLWIVFLQYEVIVHRLKKLAKHRYALLATPFLLRFLREIPVPGMENVEKKVGSHYGK